MKCRHVSAVFFLTIVSLLFTSALSRADVPPGFVLEWGLPGTGPGEFRHPFFIAASGDGHVYVSDNFNGRVQKFTSIGILVDQWTGLNGPSGIACDDAGNVYVSDSGNQRIRKYSSDGSLVLQWGSPGTGNGEFNYPAGIAIDTQGDVLVADYNNNRIQKFSGAGTYLSQWGTAGAGNGQFNNPAGIAVDDNGVVFVVDQHNHRIQSFSGAGTFLSKFGFCCAGDGSFNGPNSIAVNGSGDLYVADTGHNRVQKFTNGGSFLTKWGYFGHAPGQMYNPTGIAVDGNGIVYVADFGNDRIQKFDPTVAPPPPPPPGCNDQPKIMVHVTSPMTKNICSLGVPSSLDQAVVKGTTATASGPFYFVYLVAIRGSVPEIAGLQCGVTYENNAAGSATNGSGVDVFAWNRCATLEFPEAAWPASGSGNTITWDYISNCQTGEVAVAGYFYVGAYTADTFRVIPKPANERATVATCSPVVEIDLLPSDLGYVAFSPGAAMSGCNPCLADCAAENPIPVENTTWGRIKSSFVR